MGSVLWLLFIFQLHNSLQGILEDESVTSRKSSSDDPGEPLFLTQYVESGRAAEGRRLARVPLAEHLGVRSYAGFFTVNKTYNSNQFFWYFPPTDADEKTAPVLLWLQGGPGASSLFGLFAENGPIQVVNGTITKRECHWAASHHLVYVDNPVGTGFSFTENDAGYCSDETRVGIELYSTVVQFLQLFPELQPNDLFISGESYAGKYVPALAYTIHQSNLQAPLKVNLKGLAIGDGLSDPEHQMNYAEYLYQIGLVDWNQRDEIKEYCETTINYIRDKKWSEATSASGNILSSFQTMTKLDVYNYVKDSKLDESYVDIIQHNTVRKQIHVGNRPYGTAGSKVFDHLDNDMMQSVTPWISELLDHYDVLVYNGQLDIIVGYSMTRDYLLHLNFTNAAEYKTASRHIWSVDGVVAGYVKRAGHLIEVLVRNAGHMVPADQPRWAQDLITRFTHNQLFYPIAETSQD